jgi:hypothetical protein
MPRLELGNNLDTVKIEVQAQIDAEAEKARLRFITPGSGQALEYTKTEIEARTYLADPAPVESSKAWPWLSAEQAAQHALGKDPTLGQIAEQVIIQAQAWAVVGPIIKTIRRQAKMAVDQAPNAVAARAIAAQIVWPDP